MKDKDNEEKWQRITELEKIMETEEVPSFEDFFTKIFSKSHRVRATEDYNDPQGEPFFLLGALREVDGFEIIFFSSWEEDTAEGFARIHDLYDGQDEERGNIDGSVIELINQVPLPSHPNYKKIRIWDPRHNWDIVFRSSNAIELWQCRQIADVEPALKTVKALYKFDS